MTELTPAMKNAFRLLGITPDADQATIRSAWKVMVRAYHPDQVSEGKVEANRRLAEMNSAFDLLSAWSREDTNAHVAAHAERRTAQNMAAQKRARQAEAARRAAELRKRESKARSAEKRAARRRAAELDRREAAKRSAKATEARQYSPEVVKAREMFLAAARELTPRNPRKDLGFV